MQRQYLRFFLPLALTSLIQSAGFQIRTAILARYPDPAYHLATFGFALSVFLLPWSLNNFVPQMNNVFARSPRGRTVTRNTVLCLNLLGMFALLGLSLLPVGARLLHLAYGIEGAVLADVRRYIHWFAPGLPLSGHLQLREGLLIQARRPSALTAIQLSTAPINITYLILAFQLGATAFQAMVGVHYADYAVRLLITEHLYRRHYRNPTELAHQRLSYQEALQFLIPAAASGAILNFSRPVLLACLGRTAHPLVAVASLRVAYDMLTTVQGISNQFRHLFATYGLGDIAGKRRFMFRVAYSLSGALILASWLPPLSLQLFGTLLGLSGEVFELTISVSRILSLSPLVLMVRNFFHAQLIARAATRGMAAAAFLRLLVLSIGTPTLLYLGALTSERAAMVLVLGFAIEAAVSGWALQQTAT